MHPAVLPVPVDLLYNSHRYIVVGPGFKPVHEHGGLGNECKVSEHGAGHGSERMGSERKQRKATTLALSLDHAAAGIRG